MTKESLRQARETWERAGVRDYDLEWASSGRRNARYAVTVRGGQVDSVESVAPDGRRGKLRPAEPRYFGVEGLFLTIDEELALLQGPRPFGQPKGSKAVLRFSPDPKYGFPHHYRRDVMGAPAALAIDVLRFHPLSPPRGQTETPPR